MIDHDTVSVIGSKLAVFWHTANSAILAEGHRLLINDPTRFDGVSDIVVDEHVWQHARTGDKYVTVIIDLTPISARTGPARLLDMVPGRSKQVLKEWLKARPKDWPDGIDVVAMDGFSGFITASVEELPEATEVMDPFHVAGLFGDRSFTAVEVTRAVNQDIVTADRNEGKKLLQRVIDALTTNLPSELVELKRLRRTLKCRAADVLTYFTRPGTSNGPTEAINGRLEHLRGVSSGIPKPHPLHREMSSRARWLQTGSTLSFTMSPVARHYPANFQSQPP